MCGECSCTWTRRGLTNHDVFVSLSSCYLLSGMMTLSGCVFRFHIYKDMTC